MSAWYLLWFVWSVASGGVAGGILVTHAFAHRWRRVGEWLVITALLVAVNGFMGGLVS